VFQTGEQAIAASTRDHSVFCRERLRVTRQLLDTK